MNITGELGTYQVVYGGMPKIHPEITREWVVGNSLNNWLNLDEKNKQVDKHAEDDEHADS
jgi:hypothetical protein